MEELKGIFPSIDEDAIKAILVANNNDVQATIEYLLGMGGGATVGMDMENDYNPSDFNEFESFSHHKEVVPEKTPEEKYIEGKRALKSNNKDGAFRSFTSVLESDVLNGLKSVWGMKAVIRLLKLHLTDKNVPKAKEYLHTFVTDYECLYNYGWKIPSFFAWAKELTGVDEQELFDVATSDYRHMKSLGLFFREAAIIIGRELGNQHPWSDHASLVLLLPRVSLPSLLSTVKSKDLHSGLVVADIQQLELEGRDLALASMCILAPSIKTNSLTSLTLAETNVGPHGARILAEALSTCNNVVTVSIQDSKIGTDAASLVFAALCNNTSIRELNLDYNVIGSKVVIKLPANLTHLDLSNNCVGDEGTAQLAKYIKKSHPLKQLLLSGNEGISTVSLTKLGKALSSNSHLSSLNLSYTDMNSETATAFCQSAKDASTPVQISLQGNDISRPVKDQMRSSAQPRFIF